MHCAWYECPAFVIALTVVDGMLQLHLHVTFLPIIVSTQCIHYVLHNAPFD